jgi:poly-beta-hydroxybutyrate-responsive repressor
MPDRQTTSARRPAPGASSDGRRTRTRATDPGSPAERADDDGRDARPEGAADPADRAGEPEQPFGWPPRDFLAPFVLLAVSLQRSHGYVIEDYLRALGLFGITMSTLYRTLRQMEKDGFLESTWEPGPTGPARRVYTITDAGHVWLDSSAAMLNAYRETIDRFFGLYGAGPGNRDRRADSEAEKETPV